MQVGGKDHRAKAQGSEVTDGSQVTAQRSMVTVYVHTCTLSFLIFLILTCFHSYTHPYIVLSIQRRKRRICAGGGYLIESGDVVLGQVLTSFWDTVTYL